jgi:hypothetical protein
MRLRFCYLWLLLIILPAIVGGLPWLWHRGLLFFVSHKNAAQVPSCLQAERGSAPSLLC